jgi:DnaJ-class molecular chaperone
MAMIVVMTCDMAADPSTCSSCGGKGWKLITSRRSAASAGDAGESALQPRQRAVCLSCGGSGLAHGAGDWP